MLFTTFQPQFTTLFSMTPDVLFLVPLANRDNSAIAGALYQVAPQEFRHSFEGSSANFSLHHSNAVRREAADNTAMTVVDFFTVVQQPSADQRGDASLLGTSRRVLGIRDMHDLFLCRHWKVASASRYSANNLQWHRRTNLKKVRIS
jgi:hypothetical protein